MNDWLTAICGPGCDRTNLQAATPVGQPETAKIEELLEFDQMLLARLAPTSVIAETPGVSADLVCNK